jgi:nicotinate-nucleotide adenylyltransferase
MGEKTKIGVFGGTFDPIHYGHLRTAESVREKAGLDLIYLVPSYISPHKPAGEITHAIHRYAMVVLATIDYEGLLPSTMEIERGKPSYTIDTVMEFKSHFPEATIFFITGSDSFAEITSWKDYDQLIKNCPFLVNLRSGFPFSRLITLPKDIRARMVELTSSDPVTAQGKIQQWDKENGSSIFMIETPEMPISATEIRDLLGAGKKVSGLLPEKVIRYIDMFKLYQ